MHAPHHRLYSRRLRFEQLERRRLLSITVDTLVDENDGVGIGTGTSLREALAVAMPGDTIDFAVTGTINLATNSDLRIRKSLTINGPGANLLTIKAFDPTPTIKDGRGSGIFDINDLNDANLIDVSISGLTLTGADTGFSKGGAITTKENLTVEDGVVEQRSCFHA